MTEEEHEEMVEVGNQFWQAFSRLCNQHLAKVPVHLRAEYEMYLSEKTSLYGRDIDA